MKRFYTFSKILGIGLTLAGIPTLIIDPSSNSGIPLLVGLFILFTSNDKREDERSISIKTSSAYLALIISYGIKLVSTNLYQHSLVPVHLTEINHFLILVFTIALVTYYLRLYTFSRN